MKTLDRDFETGRFIKGHISWNKGKPNCVCKVCNKEFHLKPFAVKKGGGKYCSKQCKYKGFKGQHHSTKTEFKKGMIPWAKGKKGIMKANSGSFKKGLISWNKGTHIYNGGGVKKGQYSKEKSPSWKGGPVKKECLTCKKEFFVRVYKIKEGKGNFCSRECVASNKYPTSIEKKLYEELKSRGLLFERQKLIEGKFVVDAYIPSLNLVIEADGDYWHSLPKAIDRDKSKNAYLTKCGYGLLRLTETEINNGEFKEKLPN